MSVTDSGQGTSPELLKRCFGLFVQAKRRPERAAGGLGIGLALVDSLIGLHGGTVRAESAGPGKGSRFIVTLPLLAPAPERLSVAPPTGAGPRAVVRLKVLIVDDNQDAADTLAMLVDALGHETIVEYHPLRALERISTDPPDVCLLDVGLPDMDGYELVRAIRTRFGPKRITLVAITGYSQPQDREAALKAGFDEYFSKPVDIGKLTDLLRNSSRSS